jgi:hypothetical protein
MAIYRVWLLEASNITVSDGSLSGHTQGDGAHLVGETIRLDAADWHETVIKDGGPDTNFDDSDGGQRLERAQTIDGTTHDDHAKVAAEYRLTLRDPDTGDWLRVGDLVETRDDGPQPLRWVSAVTLSPADLGARPELRPVCIRADAFGPGQPARDMHVSPMHVSP